MSRKFISFFERSTNGSIFIPEIDGLRFYAIITVVIFHLNTTFANQLELTDLGYSLLGGKDSIFSLGWWIIRLDMGVKVFFTISGFVLALPFLKKELLNGSKILMRDYFYRRLVRLEPPFILSLFFFLIVHLFILDGVFVDLIDNFFVGLGYSHVLLYGVPNPINPVTWSLETEAQFYLIVPFLFTLFFKNRSKILFFSIFFTLFLCSIFLRKYFIQHQIYNLSTSILAFLSNFLIGILLAYFYVLKKGFFLCKSIIWDIVGLGALFLQFYFYKPQHHFINNLIFNVSTFLFVLVAFKGILFNWVFTRPFVYIIGGMCYSIYLLHFPFFHLIIKYSYNLSLRLGYVYDLVLQLFICIPALLVVSSIFYLLVEKPSMNKSWPQKLRTIIMKVFYK